MSETTPGARLVITYDRISDADESGVLDVSCEGAEQWVYADIGSFHGMQGECEDYDESVMELCVKLAYLVREHFGAVRPLT